jgi:hypothetical protein
MLGDFNEAMWQAEHFSRTRRSECQMSEFREALSFCDLHDLEFTGMPWTFDNKQHGDRNVEVRLEWCFASRRLEFNTWSLPALTTVLCYSPFLQVCEVHWGSQIRRYEVMWDREPSLGAAVDEAWSRRVGIHDLSDTYSSLRSVMSLLYDWKWQHFKPISKELDKKCKQLEDLLTCSDATSIDSAC